MSNILNTVTTDNQYMGLVKIDLVNYWSAKYTGQPLLSPNSYAEYGQMRKWLTDSHTNHRFGWINSGMYLPDYVWMDSDSATAFKLKYGI